jgi:phospholipid transport system transporter-binding protein
VSRATLESLGSGRFRISGQLDAVSVVDILKESRELFQQSPQIEIDLGGVTESDSAGLALLLEWLRLARLTDQVMQFRNLPPQVSALARISEVEDLFGITDEAVTAEPPGAARQVGEATGSV